MDDVLAPFEGDNWTPPRENVKAEGVLPVPRIEWKRHRDSPDEIVLVRKDRPAPTGDPEKDEAAHAVTVRFSKAEWAVIERQVLAGRGLSKRRTSRGR